MTDRCTEYLVKKVPDSKDNMKKFLVILAAAVITAVSIYIVLLTGFYFVLAITMVVFYGAYYLLSEMSVEYEYTFINGEIDIDKIVGKRKRVNLVTLDAGKFEDFGVYNEDTPEKPDATLFLCSDNTGEGEYYADLTTEEYGETRLIFTPSEKMVSYIDESLSPVLKHRRRNMN